MEREILFRGKDEVTKQWCYGYLLSKNVIGEVVFENDTYSISVRSVIPETVGQLWTEVKGMKLFEGDKVLVQGTKRIGEYETVIIFDDLMFKLKENKTKFIDGKEFYCVKQVIGTIHE